VIPLVLQRVEQTELLWVLFKLVHPILHSVQHHDFLLEVLSKNWDVANLQDIAEQLTISCLNTRCFVVCSSRFELTSCIASLTMFSSVVTRLNWFCSLSFICCFISAK
jgi:hypothetical protein